MAEAIKRFEKRGESSKSSVLCDPVVVRSKGALDVHIPACSVVTMVDGSLHGLIPTSFVEEIRNRYDVKGFSLYQGGGVDKVQIEQG